jgi:hypothetical protein
LSNVDTYMNQCTNYLSERAKDVVYTFKEYDIRRPKDILRVTGFKNRFLDLGAYRKVYKLSDFPLVVKFPIHIPNEEGFEEDCQHSVLEYKAYKKILSRNRIYARLIPYLPKLYYINPKTGVLLSHYYRPILNTKFRKLGDSIALLLSDIVELSWKRVEKLKPNSELDVHSGNLGLDENGRIKIIDMGYFFKN